MKKIADKIRNEERKTENAHIDVDSDADSFEGKLLFKDCYFFGAYYLSSSFKISNVSVSYNTCIFGTVKYQWLKEVLNLLSM